VDKAIDLSRNTLTLKDTYDRSPHCSASGLAIGSILVTIIAMAVSVAFEPPAAAQAAASGQVAKVHDPLQIKKG